MTNCIDQSGNLKPWCNKTKSGRNRPSMYYHPVQRRKYDYHHPSTVSHVNTRPDNKRGRRDFNGYLPHVGRRFSTRHGNMPYGVPIRRAEEGNNISSSLSSPSTYPMSLQNHDPISSSSNNRPINDCISSPFPQFYENVPQLMNVDTHLCSSNTTVLPKCDL